MGPKSVMAPPPQENQRRKDQQFHTLTGKPEETAFRGEGGARDIGYDAGKADADQQKGFIFLHDAQEEKDKPCGNHDEISEGKIRKSCLMKEFRHQRDEKRVHGQSFLSGMVPNLFKSGKK